MASQAAKARIQWLSGALAKSKLDNEQQRRELADRDEQIRQSEAALADRDEQIRDPLDEQAPSPPELPGCIIQ